MDAEASSLGFIHCSLTSAQQALPVPSQDWLDDLFSPWSYLTLLQKITQTCWLVLQPSYLSPPRILHPCPILEWSQTQQFLLKHPKPTATCVALSKEHALSFTERGRSHSLSTFPRALLTQGHLQLTIHPSLVSSIDSFCSVCKNTSCQTRGNTSFFYFLFEMSLPCLHYQSPFPSTLLSTSCNLSISGFLLRTSLKGTPWPANYHTQWQWGDHHQIEGLQVTIRIVLFCVVYIFYIEHIESEKHLTVAFF